MQTLALVHIVRTALIRTGSYRVLYILFLLALAIPVSGASSLSLRCGRESVGLGEEFIVRLTFEGEGDFDGRFSIRNNPAFSVAEGGVSQSMSFGYTSGGTATRKRLYSRDYIFVARRVGIFTLGPGYYIQNGRRYASRTHRIRVTRQASSSTRQQRRGFSSFFRNEDDDPPLRLRVNAALSRKQPFVSQEVILYLDVFASSRDSFRIRPIVPPISGFWVEQSKQLVAGDPEEVRNNGDLWYKYRFELARLYPASTGRLRIPPIKGALGTSGFFAQQYTFTTPELFVTARELPGAGKPDGFSGVVGVYTLTAEPLERAPVAGEPFQLAVLLAGRGLMQTVTRLETDASTNHYRILQPRIVSSDPQVSAMTNIRRFLYTLYPNRHGRIPLPVFSLTYFDPETGEYRTTRTLPGQITVAPGSPNTTPSDAGTDSLATAPLVYACSEERSMLPFPKSVYLVIVPIFALLSMGNLLYLRRRMALEADPSLGRMVSAYQLARSRLSRVHALLKKEECNEALGLMEKAMKGYVADKLGISGGGVLYTTLQEKMEATGFSRELIREFVDLCSEIGQLRYGGNPDLVRCQDEWKTCRSLLVRLKKEWP